MLSKEKSNGKIQEFGFYTSYKDLGNHESYMKKVGDFTGVTNPVRITKMLQKNIAKIIIGDEEIMATEGMILGTNAILKTDGAEVELKTVDDSVFRLIGKSEFCLESTMSGIIPVVYGNVFYKQSGSFIKSYWKYRTSCYVGKSDSYIIERIDEKQDIYYNLSEELNIYEYDERGNKFDIVNIMPYQKCILSYDSSKPMLKRYTVTNVENLKENDILKIYANYMSNEKWIDEVKEDITYKAI